MSKKRKEIPAFETEAQERAFWRDNDSTEFLDWGKAQKVALPNLKPSTKATNPVQPGHP